MRQGRVFVGSLAVLLVVLARVDARGQEELVFVDDSFEDFASGRLDASGHNLYVSRDGTLRTIQRFDLNQDGFLDLLFNSTHDTTNFLPATVGVVKRDRRLAEEQLPVDGSLRVILEDLNLDGHLDAVFCPNDSGLQHPRRFVAVYWGDVDGWSPRRATGPLPVNGAMALVTADLNQDRWPDIVVLNTTAWLPGQPEGRILRVFWGGADGYLLGRRHDLGVSASALDLAAADLDLDGYRDVAILTTEAKVQLVHAVADVDQLAPRVDLRLPGVDVTSLTAADLDADGATDLVVGGSRSLYLLSSRLSGHWLAATEIPVGPVAHVSVGDLDADGATDLVLTRPRPTSNAPQAPETVQVRWGGPAGVAAGPTSHFNVPFASATAIGDLDDDGRVDLVVAVHQGAESYEARSPIFFGAGGRRFTSAEASVTTTGATWVAVAPPSPSLDARVVFSNSVGGTVDERVPLYLYWGGADGFDPSRRWEIPFRSGYEASAADLNADGFVDLIAMNSQHAGITAETDPTAGANIFWGSADGFDIEGRRTVLRERRLGSSSVADLNRDGYLDLVLGAFESPQKPDLLVIYYGTADGYTRARRIAIPSSGRTIGSLIADVDRDGWLDITAVASYVDEVHILRGGPNGFDAASRQVLRVPFPISTEAADLDADGFLDLIVGSYQDPLAGHHDTGLLVFWGSQTGFRSTNMQWLPGSAPIGMAVADFDADGHLDLFAPHYLGELTRESLPSYLYWGGPDGLASRRRTILIADSAHDALAADFDRDGRLDLAVSSHTRDGDHHTASKVFYNDGGRFTRPRIVDLPTVGTHWMWDQDMGHIEDRQWRQSFESGVKRWRRSAVGGRVKAEGSLPTGPRLRIDLRSALHPDDLAALPWTPIEQEQFVLDADDRVLQYRATLLSDNGDRYPVLDRVTIELFEDRPAR